MEPSTIEFVALPEGFFVVSLKKSGQVFCWSGFIDQWQHVSRDVGRAAADSELVVDWHDAANIAGILRDHFGRERSTVALWCLRVGRMLARRIFGS